MKCLKFFPNISDPFANTGYVLEKNAISLLLGVADVNAGKIPGTKPFIFFRSLINIPSTRLNSFPRSTCQQLLQARQSGSL